MKLRDYLASLNAPQKAAFFERLGRHPIYIQSIAAGSRKASPALARDIETASRRRVRRWELRPDVWDAPKPRKEEEQGATT